MPGSKLRLLCRLLVWTVMVLSGLVLLLLVCCAPAVWLPDVLPPHRWKSVGAATLPDGQDLRVFQKWGSDFYETVIAARKESHPVNAWYIDCDDNKLWTCRFNVTPRSNLATIALNDDELYTYDWKQCDMVFEDCKVLACDPADLPAELEQWYATHR